MLIDLHNHTARCRHAEGAMEEYVLMAIREGIEVFGFSDHAPLKWDVDYRMKFGEMDGYEADFYALKEKYRGKIKLLLAYEADYLPRKTYKEVFERKVDYLIGSVHFLGSWGFDNPSYIGEFSERDPDKTWKSYFGAVADMAKTGLYNIVGHIDLIKLFGHFAGKKPDESVIYALEEIKKSDMAIEINYSGWRRPVEEQYPSIAILKEAYSRGIAITFGSDSHSPSQIALESSRAYDLARSAGYKEARYYEDRKIQVVKI